MNTYERQHYLMGDYGDRICSHHSYYKGWEIVREFDYIHYRYMMSYFAIKDGEEPLHAKNLSGIKAAVSEVTDYE